VSAYDPDAAAKKKVIGILAGLSDKPCVHSFDLELYCVKCGAAAKWAYRSECARAQSQEGRDDEQH
jgi:hypothetical protein